jgi:hypothetical protein
MIMNAKEEIIDILQEYEHSYKDLLKRSGLFPREVEIAKQRILDMQHLITAVENAIFDVPSVEVHGHSEYSNGFRDGINYIINYKKPETNGK